MNDRRIAEDGQGFGEVSVGPAEPDRLHNNPPEGLRVAGDALELHIATTHAAAFKRASDLIEAEARLPKIDNPEAESKATEFVKQIQAAERALDRARLAEKGPYDLAASHIHGAFRTVQDKLVRPDKKGPPQLKERVEGRLTNYKLEVLERERLRLEEEAKVRRAAEAQAAMDALWADAQAELSEFDARKAAEAALRKRNPDVRAAAQEEAARLAGQAEEARTVASAAGEERDQAADSRAIAERQAAAPPAELTRARGGRGGVSSLTTFWDFRDLDRDVLMADLQAKLKAPGDVPSILELLPHIPMTAIEQAIRAYVTANKDRITGGHKLKGVTFFENYRTGVR